MSQQLNKIKSRIKTVNGAYKVTSAMKLVSQVKLKRYKNKMLANKEYNYTLDEVTQTVLKNAKKVRSPFALANEGVEKKLYIVISSTLGLCGSYNMNIFKEAESLISEKDDAIILGNKGAIYFKDGSFNKIDDFSEYSSISDEKIIREIVSYISKKYLAKEYQEVHIIYTEYKNSLTFIAKDKMVLPLGQIETNEYENEYPPLLEPSQSKLVETLIPLYIRGTIYAKLLESEVCEQAARANAMDNATNNAKDILDNLKVEFNKARQGAITQEITEIVSAANAI